MGNQRMIPLNTDNDKPRLHPQFLALFLLSLPLSLSLETCPIHTCPTTSPISGHGPPPPPIHFPFAASNLPRRCGYPNFTLTCNNLTQQPILSLPPSGDFSVQLIDYLNQLIWISDPSNCLPNRILTLTLGLSNSPFSPVDTTNYTLLNCSTSDPTSLPSKAIPVPCLGAGNFTVYVTSRESTVLFLTGSGQCRVIQSGLSPSLWPLYRTDSGPDLATAFIPLSWSLPDCGDCERNGGECGFVGGSGLDIGCSVSVTGVSKLIKYGLIIGLGLPGILCTIGLIFYYSERRIRRYRQRQLQVNTELSPSIVQHPTIITVGLDGQTIDSYPKTLLGESRRLPNPSDVHCAICLSEYEAKEALRTIPECNHYFHAECIDEWLRMKGTCPLCRNSPAT